MPSYDVAAALVEAYGSAPLDEPPTPTGSSTLCAMTGVSIEAGYPLHKLISDATADIADTFPYRESGMVSVVAASAFRDGSLSGNLCVIIDSIAHGLRPMVSRESATAQDRPCWADVLRTLRPGQQTMIVLSNESKRRLWPRARLAPVGPAWSVYLHDETGSAPREISHARLIACLDLVEEIYAAGFSKPAMRRGLLAANNLKTIEACGWPESRRYEASLRAWRATQELAVALFVAQRPLI